MIRSLTHILSKSRIFQYKVYNNYNNNDHYDYNESPKLGRWKIDYNQSIIHHKIDQANEDHCGCCINEFNDKDDKEDEEYMIPYCM